MPLAELRGFRGIAPRALPHTTPGTIADRAINADLRYNTIRPFLCPTLHCEAPVEIAQFTPTPADPCCVRDTCVSYTCDSCYDIVYWSDENDGVKLGTTDQFCNGNECPWNIPCPDAPIVSDGAVDEDCRIVHYAYQYIMEVDGRCFFGPLSPPSQEVAVTDMLGNQISGWDIQGKITGVKLYRYESASQDEAQQINTQGTYICIATLSSNAPYTDMVQIIDSQMRPPLFDRMGNPPAGLHSVGKTRSDVFVGLEGQCLYWTYPDQPFTFSERLKVTIDPKDGEPLCLIVCEENLIIFTTETVIGASVVIDANGPQVNLSYDRTCLPMCNKKGFVKTPDGVLYITDCGLALASLQVSVRDRFAQVGVQMITDQLYTIEQWRKLDPKNMVIGKHKDFIVLSSPICSVMIYTGNGVSTPTEGVLPMELNLVPPSVYEAQGKDYPFECLPNGEMSFCEGVNVGATQIHSDKDTDDGMYFVKGNQVWKWEPYYAEPKAKGKGWDDLEGECCPWYYEGTLARTFNQNGWKVAQVDTNAMGRDDLWLRLWHECCNKQTGENVCVDICKQDICCGQIAKFPACKRVRQLKYAMAGCKEVRTLYLATSAIALGAAQS